jgi:hypothetical protein
MLPKGVRNPVNEGKARIFDLKRVNLFLLRKQHLTEQTKSNDIIGIAGDICGLHATSATTPYLSLFARMKDFRKERLDEELYSKRTLGKVRGVRGTVYIHPRDMIPAAYTANRRSNIPLSERFYRYMDRTEEEYELLSRRILELLSGRGMTAAQIKKELGEEKSVSRVLNLMCDYGLLIRGAPAGGWRSNVHTYHLFEEYMPGVDLESLQEDKAREIMVRRYLSAFGPACVDDIAWWTAFRKGEVKAILEQLDDVVSVVRIEGLDREYLMLGSQESELDATKRPQKPVVNLLPMLDPYLMSYKERYRYLSPGYFPYIYDRSGNATNCILVAGRIVGVWDYDEQPPTFKYFLFEQVSKRSLQVLEKQASRLGEFLSSDEVEYRECADMTSLAERTAGGFMTPLKGC